MNCLLVPTLAYDLAPLSRLADSIDYRIPSKVVINNGRRGALDEWIRVHPQWSLVETAWNMGVSGSWNYATRLWPNDPCWLIVNDDAWFEKGALEQICSAATQHREAHFIFSNLYWCCFVWTRVGKNLCGLFDENFYPGYYEDTDMFVRIRLKNAFTMTLDDPPGVLHGRGSHSQKYENARSEWCQHNEQYFMRKWGNMALKLHKPYDFPFNNPQNKVNSWEIDTTHIANNRRIWDSTIT